MENGSGTKGLQSERGLDTVKLQGEGFELLALPGQDVKTGDLILRLDRDMKIVFSRGSLVKITKVINNNSVVALAMGTIPQFQKGLMEQQVSVEKLVVEAWIERSYQKLWQAMTLSRTVPSAKVAKEVLDALMKANGDFWPKLS